MRSSASTGEWGWRKQKLCHTLQLMVAVLCQVNYTVLDISLFDIVHHDAVAWNSSVGKAARYGLDGPGIES